MGGNLTQGFWWKEHIFPDFGHCYQVELVFEKRGKQRVQVFKNPSWGYFLVLDGIVQFTERDEYIYHETITYFPASLLPSPPESVLIIGGGDGGVLREVQKIPSVKKICQYELDFIVFEVCQKYFFELSGDFSDPRVSFNLKDGLTGLKECQEEEFDLIIVDSTDPVGPAKSLYTPEFYKEASRVLKSHGVFIQQASLPVYFPNVIKEALPGVKEAFSYWRIIRAFVPCYGEEIAFFVAAKEEKDWSTPKLKFYRKYYRPELHTSYLTLPPTWEEILK